MIGKFLEWEKGLRDNAKEVDARGSVAKEKQQARADEAKATRLAAKTEKLNAKAAKAEAKKAKKEGYAGRDIEAVLTEAERTDILRAEVKRLMGWGSPWKIDTKGDAWAQMIDKAADPMGTGSTLMAIGTLGLSMAVTPVRRGRQNDKTLLIEVLPNGAIERTGGLLYAGKDFSNVPEL